MSTAVEQVKRASWGVAPALRLVWAAALIGVPLALLAAWKPAALPTAVLAAAIFLLLAGLDWWLGCGRMAELQATAEPQMRMTAGKRAEIALRVDPQGRETGALRFGLSLPPVLGLEQTEQDLLPPATGQPFRVVWKLCPQRRGRFHCDLLVAEGRSPLGLWLVRRRLPLAGEIQVFPNLDRERKLLAGVFMHRGLPGQNRHRQVGRGREFEKLREYQPGDSFDDIHWKATAKRRAPVTKEYQIEHTQEIVVVIDASRLSGRPAAGDGVAGTETVLDHTIRATLVLQQVAERQGDRFGLAVFTDNLRHSLKACLGHGHFQQCRNLLYHLQPQPVMPDLDEICAGLRLHYRRRALLLFLTSLDDSLLAEGFLRNAERLSRQHVVLVNMVRPEGVRPLFSDPGIADEEALCGALAGHWQWRRLRELEVALRQRGVRFAMLEPERLALQLATQYLEIKQRQLL